jgi:hypothetical protein
VPESLFRQADLLSLASLAPPPVVALGWALQSQGLQGNSLTVEAFCEEYIARVNEQPHHNPGPGHDVDSLSSAPENPRNEREGSA